MRVSELIEKLTAIQQEHSDMPVHIAEWDGEYGESKEIGWVEVIEEYRYYNTETIALINVKSE